MKRYLPLLALATFVAGLAFMASCSSPLESYPIPNPPGPIFDVDTVVITDTLIQTDTVTQIDTLVQVDTVIVYLPDTSTTTTMCARMGSHQKEIVWMLRTEAGRYLLEFSAYVERGQPPQRVTLSIDGAYYEWLPRDQPVFVIETDVGQYPTIMILPENPAAFGHSIDFCLTVTRL